MKMSLSSIRGYFLQQSESLREFARGYGKYTAGTLIIGILSYFSLMAEELNNNYDGIWHLSNFVAGDFEISLGRGLERYADRARFGVVSSPLGTILCLLLLGISLALIIRRFELGGTRRAWFIVFLMTVNPSLCDTLSYIYLAVNYLLACFFAVFAFYLLTADAEAAPKARIRGILSCAVALAVSMALYQAYFDVFCVLLVFYGIRMILQRREIREILRYCADALAGILCGGIFYLLLTKALLFRAGTTMADYKGAADIGPVTILLAFPASFVKSYQEACNYIFCYHFWTDLEFAGILCALLVIGLAALALCRAAGLFRSSKVHFALYLLFLALIPPAANAVLFLAVGNVMTGLMATGLLLSVALSLILLPEADRGPAADVLRVVWPAILVLFGWYALFTVTNDQLALREGRTATVTLTEQIVSELYRGNYLEAETPRSVALVGRPGNNPYFARSKAFDMANEYAQFGYWSTDPRNNRVSWYGVLTGYLGVTFPLCDDVTYDTLRATDAVAAMPVFPAAGSIEVIQDVVVVKVSDLYD